MGFLPARRRVRTPFRLQFQTTECGIGVLAIMLAHFGRDVPMEEIRRVAGVSRDALSARDLVRTARHFGLEARALRREPQDLPALGFPLVVHLRFIHFSVIEGMTERKVLFNDPHAGRIEKPIEQFFEDFTGVVLSFRPGPEFIPESAGRNALPIGALGWPRRGGSLLAGSLLGGTLLGALSGLAVAGLAGALAAGQAGWAALAAIAIGLSSGAAALISSAAIRRDAGKRAHDLAARLPAMPQSFFSYRLPDRLCDCFDDTDHIARLLHGKLVPALSGLAGLPPLLAAAVMIEPGFGLALAISAACCLAAMLLLQARAGDGRREQRSGGSDELPGLATACEDPDGLKIAGRDDELFVSGTAWGATKARLRQGFGVPAGMALAAPRIFDWTALAALLCIEGPGLAGRRIGVGAILGLAAIAVGTGRILRPLAAIADNWDELRHRRFHVDDAMACEPAPPPATGPAPTGEGRLRLDCVSFGFAPLTPPFLRDLSLDVRPGEQLGIAGPSGGGKSTLAGLLAGMFQPWSGRIELDGVPLREIAPAARAKAIAWVGKRTFFFDGSVRDNLRLWDDDVAERDIRDAVKDACLDEVLARRPGGLDSPVTARGRNFSGGQRQRLEIARAILRKPRILILDEAMDGLDPALEARIRANLRRRGCSLVVIAHRRSTLSDCDRILVLRDGRLAEADDLPSEPPPCKEVSPGQAMRGVDRSADAALIEAFRLAAAGHRVHPPVVGEIADGSGGVWDLARLCDIPVRPVRIRVASWWRRLHGTIIAFDRQDGRPLVIRADGEGPVLLDPADGSRRRLDADGTAMLAAEAWQIYFESAPGSPIAALRPAATGELARAALASLGLAALGAAIPLAAIGLSAPAPPLWPAAGLGLSAALLLEGWRNLALLRAEVLVERRALATLLRRLPLIAASALRRLAPEEIAAALHGMPRFLDPLRGEAAAGLLDAGLVPAGLAIIAWLDRRLVPPILVLCLAAVAIPAVAARAVARRERRDFLKRSAHRRFLLGLLWNFPRLSVLDRARSALDRWSAGHDAQSADEARLRRLDAVSAAAGAWILWSGMTLAASRPAAAAPALLLAAWLSLKAAADLGESLGCLARSRPFVDGLAHLTEAPREPGGDRTAEAAAPLEMKGLVYRYPGEAAPALAGIDLTLEPGRITALAGPSGGGKSTLLRLLLGIDEPDEGEVRLGGVPLARIDRRAWRRQVGTVFQDDWAPSACTIRSQIAGASWQSLAEVWQAAEAALLAEDIRRLPMGIQSILQDSGFSTGQIQRLLIARQLVRRPKLLILDEATNAVPEDMQAALIANFRRLGLTCLLVTHRQSAIAAADRVLVLESGRLTFSGPPERFFEDEERMAMLRAEA